MAITVPYKVMPKGFEISGDVRSGYHATVPYLLAYEDALQFTDDVVGNPQAVRVGAITWKLPLQFPGFRAACRCSGFRLTPCGADGDLPITYGGLAPGEYFTHAIVTLQFDTPPQIQGFEDDPNGLQQLDPANPITMCEQSTKISGKMVTRKGMKYRYIDDNKPVAGDFAKPESETKLILKFPQVPYLPWQLVQPYVNKVNSLSCLSCDPETLLLEGMGTDIKYSLNSLTGGISQQVVLEFAVQANNWNKVEKPDGSLAYAYYGGDASKRIYEKVDFGAIFAQLQFQEVDG